MDTLAAQNKASGWEIRAMDMIFNDFVDADFWGIDIRTAGVDDFA